MIVFAITTQMTIRSNHKRCSVRKVFLEISQNSQENTCVRFSFLIKLQALSLQLYWKRNSGTRVFLWILRNFWEHLFHRTSLDDYLSTIQHFLVENPSKVLNGQQQHKGVIFHWSRISTSLVKLFKFLHYNHRFLCSANAPWGMQWRYREKRNDQEHHENVIFFHLAKFWMVFFCSLENVLFNSHVSFLRKCRLQFPCWLLCYLLM